MTNSKNNRSRRPVDRRQPLRKKLAPSIWAIRFQKSMADAGISRVDLNDHVSLLKWAIFSDQTCEAKRLIEFGVDVNAEHEDDLGCSFLEHAASKGNLEIVKLLILHGADANHVGKEGSALTCAAHSGHNEVYDFLKSRTNRKQREIAKRHVACGRYSREERESVNQFIDSASRGLFAKFTRYLRSGIEVNATSSYGNGWTALHAAAAKGHSEIVDQLLKCGADPNMKSFDGCVPLHSVALEEDCRRLLEAGATPLTVNDLGEGVVPYVALSARHRQSLFPRRIKLDSVFDKNLAKIFRQLLSSGADVNSQIAEGQTALFFVTVMGLFESAKVLVNAGINCDIEDRKGKTAIEFVGKNVRVRKLLEARH